MRRDLMHSLFLAFSVAVLSFVGHAAYAAELDQAKGKHWIGVVCDTPDDALRAQLKLPEKPGLIVSRVQDESPAAAAGVQPHDILLSANDKPLGEVGDLIKSIREAGDHEIKFVVLRAGERKELSVQPKPVSTAAEDAVAGQPFSVKIMRPGQLVGPGGKFMLKLASPELPPDTTVTITRHGKDKPAIKVERNDQKWDLTEDKLDDLPAELRGPVAAMVHPFPLPPPVAVDSDDGDVLFFTTKGANIPGVGPALKFLQDSAKEKGADVAYQKALTEATNAQRIAQEKLQQAKKRLAEVQGRLRASKVMEEDITPRVESAVESAKQWSLERLDARFDQLQKQLDELRQAVKAARGEVKPAAPPAAPAPPAEVAPPAPPAEPAPPAPPKTPEAR